MTRFYSDKNDVEFSQTKFTQLSKGIFFSLHLKMPNDYSEEPQIVCRIGNLLG